MATLRRFHAPLMLLLVLGVGCATPAASPSRAPAPAPPATQATVADAAKPAWQQEWEQVLAAARQEGRVVVIGTPGDTIREAMVGGFRKAYPDVTLEWSGVRGNDALAKISAERSAGVTTVDVVLAG